MIHQKYEDVLFETGDAYIHDAYPGFKEDYLILHSLLRKYKPKIVFEIGTNIGSGVNVIGVAVPDAQIFSLDLDYETMCQNSKQYPLGENQEDRVGSAVLVPYTQLRGDSLTFNYGDYQIDAAYIDGEHDTEHVYFETLQMMLRNPKIIICHDADMSEVISGILLAYIHTKPELKYYLFRVKGTRIAYLLREDIAIHEHSNSYNHL